MRVLIIILLISSLVTPIQVLASSSGDDGGAPPAGGGGGGGGGSPQFYDYYIPLIFNESSKYGLSYVTIWNIQPTVLITTFDLNEVGVRFTQIDAPSKITFNPRDNKGLTNGSLIRTTSPVLIIGNRLTEDVFADNSFAYSILNDRMMGFEFISPVNGWLTLFSLSPQTLIQVTSNDGTYSSKVISQPGTTETVSVKIGDYINSSFPVNGAFISYEDGTAAAMALPLYLQGDEYMFDSDILAPRVDEIDNTYIQVIPSEPTELEFTYTNNKTVKSVIFGTTEYKVTSDLRGISSSRGKITVNLNIQTYYGGKLRRSLIQMIDATEMRSGEVFAVPNGFSVNSITINNQTSFITGAFDPSIGGFTLSSRKAFNLTKFDTISYSPSEDIGILVGNHSSFSFLTTPGKIGHPMSPSATFLNIPLNAGTNRPNITGIKSTWYRFPNLAVENVEIIPGPPEEYTGQIIRVTIISNGSLPSSRFLIDITIDGIVEVEERYDFLQVNDTLVFNFERFLGFGVQDINVTVRVDVNNDVNEINEEDNNQTFDVAIEENIRLKWSFYGGIFIILSYIALKIRQKIKERKKQIRSRVDVILTFEEQE